MLLDLAEVSRAELPQRCDVAIIGAGIAGSVLACELSRRGKRVIVLESGGLTQNSDTHPLNRVVQRGADYRGAEHGRFRCLGGTSTRWGGALIPFRREDLEGVTGGAYDAWPLGLDELSPWLAAAERLFELPSSPYELSGADADTHGGDADFELRAAKWPAFANRNVARLLDAQLRAADGPFVCLNATLTSVKLGADGRARYLIARAGAGARIEIEAREVVFAAGAIESTRLLLQLNADHDDRAVTARHCLGRYFHDHLSAPVARIAQPARESLDRLVGFRFEGAAMRNARFELASRRRQAQCLPGAFLHVACTTTTPSGFDGLRGIYRAVQRRSVPSQGDLALVTRNAGWFARAAWHRVMESRVLPPDGADYEVHLVTEQIPIASNRITLSRNVRDPFNLPVPEIDWRVSPLDVDNATRVLDAFADYWAKSALSSHGNLECYSRDRWAAGLEAGGGIYHPGGTLRMGLTASDGVVDRDLRVFGIPNLRALSTAAFPTGGSANPTLMLILFALRAAQQLSRD